MTQHIEEARKLEPVAAYTIDHTGCWHLSLDIKNIEMIAKAGAMGPTRVEPLVRLSDAQTALAAAGERGRREERERCAKAHDVLAGLSSFLGAGLGDESTTAEQYDKRIRWGIDELQSSIIRLCMEKVELCSERPSTTWGEVKASLSSILPPAITKEPIP